MLATGRLVLSGRERVCRPARRAEPPTATMTAVQTAATHAQRRTRPVPPAPIGGAGMGEVVPPRSITDSRKDGLTLGAAWLRTVATSCAVGR